MTRTRLARVLTELRRRKVYQVAAAYAAVGVAIAATAPDIFSAFDLPSSAARLVVVLIVLGFPLALVLAWLFDVRPEEPPAQAVEPTHAASEAPAPTQDGPLAQGAPPPDDSRPSLAVLPFASFSDDHETDYFGLGIMEDVLQRLAQVKGIRLISRTSSMRYRAAEKCTRDIARELGVRTILEGSVRRSNGHVRVVAQLIDGITDEHLWAEVYDRELQDVFGVQTEIAETIATALSAELSEEERERVRRIPTQHLGAWDLYLKALQTWQTMGPRELAEALGYLEQALRLDPGFAAAWGALAQILVLLATYGDPPPMEIYPRIRDATHRALELDPRCGQAHVALAVYRFFHDWDLEGAHAELDRALALDPDSTFPVGWKAVFLALCGRPDQAMAMAHRTLALDPFSAAGHGTMGVVLTLVGRFEEAQRFMSEATEHWPQSSSLRRWLGLAFLQDGKPHEALAQFELSAELAGHLLHYQAYRALPLASLGRAEEARQILAELVVRSETEWVDPYNLFLLSVGLEGPDAAWPYLEQAAAERSFLLPYVVVSPRLRPLFLADPRYRAVAEQILPGVMAEA